jgi:hypothetical protein
MRSWYIPPSTDQRDGDGGGAVQPQPARESIVAGQVTDNPTPFDRIIIPPWLLIT